MIKIPETEFLAVVTNDTKNNVYVFAYQTFKSRSEFPCYDCHPTWLLFIFFNIIIFLALHALELKKQIAYLVIMHYKEYFQLENAFVK